MRSLLTWFKPYISPRVLPLLWLGIASGLPLALTGGTLQAWATTSEVSLKSIGFLTLVGSAYTFKFIWAPLLDRYHLPFLDKRRSWIVLSQILLAIGIFLASLYDPKTQLSTIAALAVIIAFLSATQDIAFDAYSREILTPNEMAAGAAIKVLGYRIGMIISGGFALIMADPEKGWGLGWHHTYQIMAGLMIVFAVLTALAPALNDQISKDTPKSLVDSFIRPFQEFLKRNGAIMLLITIVLYKLGDAFAGALSTSFLIRGAGFATSDVGVANKIFGIIASIVGAIFGGALMSRWGVYRSLLIFGILQAVSNLAYWLVSCYPNDPISGIAQTVLHIDRIPHLYFLFGAVAIENICGGMGTAAFVGFIMLLCNQRYTATQFALLSALASVARVYLSAPSGYLVEQIGWSNFFLFTVITAIPGILLLYFNRHLIRELDK